MKYYPGYSTWEEQEFVELLEKHSIKKTSGISFRETKEFLDSIGNPEQELPTAHVAGTNGKGSVVSYISSAFIADGRKVGTFISPHVCDYRERFLIDCAIQPGGKVLGAFMEMLEYKPKNMTKFELMAAFAFYFFKKEKADIAVVETGMGGRLDATRACNPFVTVITGIAIDHKEYLGNTLTSIAAEKLGIVKQGVPLYLCSDDRGVRELALKTCAEKKAKCNFVDYEHTVKKHSLEELEIAYSFNNHKTAVLGTDMPGEYQIKNMATAFLAIEEQLELSSIKKGFRNAFIPLRMQLETINGVPVLFDAGHNPEGITALAGTLKKLGLSEKPIGLLFNCKHNKDWQAMASTLFSLNVKKAIFPRFGVGKQPEELLALAKLNGIKDCTIAETALQGLKELTDKSKGEFEFVLATGSIYMLGEIVADSIGKKTTVKEQD